MFASGAALNGVVALFSPNERMAAVLTARPILNAGLALMAAGILCAEVLRRGVGVPRRVGVLRDASQRIEVTHPPELATRLA